MAGEKRNTDEFPEHLWIGRNVQTRRAQLGLTQHELAKLVKTSQPYLGHLEGARVNATVEVLARIAKALQTDAATLLMTEAEAAVRFGKQTPNVHLAQQQLVAMGE